LTVQPLAQNLLRVGSLTKLGLMPMISVIRNGMDVAIQNLNITSNNIANARTTGYKRRDANFTDVYSTAISTSTGDRLGIGAKSADIRMSQMQGVLQKTNGVLDLAIEGEGLFALRDESNPEANLFTRDGSFQMTKDGLLVNRDGYSLLSANNTPITIPTEATGIVTANGFQSFGGRRQLSSLAIRQDGNIEASYGGSNIALIAKVGLASFADPNRLKPAGANLFRSSRESGAGDIGEAKTDGRGKIHSGALEMANTNITEELSNMIRAQQAFSGSSRLLQSEAEMVKRFI
jgi:flagellar basal-body rod protein FlgG